jgi:hypothetical protein
MSSFLLEKVELNCTSIKVQNDKKENDKKENDKKENDKKEKDNNSDYTTDGRGIYYNNKLIML